MTAANAIVIILVLYAAAGAVFAIAFVSARIERDASAGFRLIVLPGAMALWPVLLKRWTAAAKGART